MSQRLAILILIAIVLLTLAILGMAIELEW